MEYHHIPIDGKDTEVHHTIASLPLLFKLMDTGGFYISCAMGRHRTDIAVALYYAMHPSVPFGETPEMKGHRDMGKRLFRCDHIATRLNSVMREITPDELATLGITDDYEAEFTKRKKRLLEVNRNFEI